MDYYRQIADKWRLFDARAKYEVDRDLGAGTTFKLIGRNGLIFARGPFVWEFNVDAKMYGGSFIPEMKAWCFTAGRSAGLFSRRSILCDIVSVIGEYFEKEKMPDLEHQNKAK